MFNRTVYTEGRGFRLERERREAHDKAERIRGFGLAIDYLDGWPHDARPIDHSPVLSLEKVLPGGFEDAAQRRFGFVEFAGEGTPPRTGALRSVGDAFFADRRVADFVWQAVIEKIENDAAQGAAA
ncbi:hypothetical protein [Chelativorans sp. AA-79]|uniref:hypothetical protein n=1 Tax=Chelativorans sp. AA-79 TaxID=3028735 RepID=UPI0023F9ADB2|nr:hypothetical protein [Chelativorans sp. AA-79]WEX07388.1 hypothetical protein PVE73_14785 [Chelativorans sp. AA-79]